MRLQKFSFLIITYLAFTMHELPAQTNDTLTGRVYFVDASGNDQNDGSEGRPWKTLKKVISAALKAGDSILLAGGQEFKGPLVIKAKGNKQNPIIISSSGKQKAVINGGKKSALVLDKAGFVTIEHLLLTGAGRKTGNTTDGFSLTACNDIAIDDIEISGFQKAGLLLYTSRNIRVTNVYAHDNGFAGISVLGNYQEKNRCSNIYIGHCRAENNPGCPVILNNHSGNGIIAGGCSKVLIEYCTATNNGWDMPRKGNGPVGIWCYEADSVVIQHCLSYRNKTSIGGGDGGGFDLDGGVSNSIIQYCLSYQNQGSGFGLFQYAGAGSWHNNVLRYNISEDDGNVSAAGAGVYIWNGSDDATRFYNCFFYNNTIINKNGAAIAYSKQSLRKGFRFYNNILLADKSLLKGNYVADIFTGNNWWSSRDRFNVNGKTGLAVWAKKSGKEMLRGRLTGFNIQPVFSLSSDSLITNAAELKSMQRYKTGAESALYQKGIDLKAMFGIDAGLVNFNGATLKPGAMGASY